MKRIFIRNMLGITGLLTGWMILLPLNSFAETTSTSSGVASTTSTTEVTDTSAAPATEPSFVKPDTTQIQQALTQAGYYKGTVDGVMGPRTRRAIRAFQEASGLAVDGKCGRRTWDKLKQYLAASGATATTTTTAAPSQAAETAPAVSASGEDTSAGGENLKHKLVQ